MIRAVLAATPEGPWRLFRQAQWMAEVRRGPAAASRQRHHFDLEESAFDEALGALRADPSLDAPAMLARLGAIAVGPR